MEITSNTGFMNIGSAGKAAASPDGEAAARKELRAAAEGFEALFLNQLMKSARAGGFGDDLTGGSAVRSAQDMFDTQVSQLSSSSSNLGIADAIERQLSPIAFRSR